MSIIEQLRKGNIPEVLHKVARLENVELDHIVSGILEGTVVVPHNNLKTLEKPCAIGKGFRIKVNANIGTSQDHEDIEEELEKLKIAVKYGADAVMDLSTGDKARDTRLQVIKNSTVPVGTVPVYEAFLKAGKHKGTIMKLTADDIFEAIEQHGKDGVDFVTVHCGLTMESVERMKKQGRLADVVSRGGSLLIEWMVLNEKENPLYEHFDRLLEICRKYEMTISLGDGMRPGAIEDATDRAQIQELIILGELAQYAVENGVQVMIEGPGHVPLDQVETNMKIQKTLCNGAPFYVLGPIVTDIAPGYDHITAAIGGAVAAMSGADFLCYVTPAEHLRLPTVEDVKVGVIASKIAAHAADIAKGLPGAKEWDYRMSKYRKELNWEGMFKECIDEETARKMRGEIAPQNENVCSMCGEFCALKTLNDVLK